MNLQTIERVQRLVQMAKRTEARREAYGDGKPGLSRDGYLSLREHILEQVKMACVKYYEQKRVEGRLPEFAS